jgi:ribosomal protein S18 acetylase RimI-like enzyme
VSIAYSASLDGVAPEHLRGFFEGWPSPPTPERHLEILRGSYRVFLAREAGSPAVVGFVNALSDGVLAAFLPLLEVLPSHRGRGIGSELVRRILDDLGSLYSVDVVCDHELGSFYERFGMQPLLGMALRRPDVAPG